MAARRFERYVAIGDSTTEGLDDPDGAGGFRGWANRLAERIATAQGSLLYANLAVRGLETRRIRETQLARAAAMRPDLATVVSGTNDMLRPRFDARAVGDDIEHMQRVLVDAGAMVLTFTLPDMSRVMPLAHLLSSRLARYNDALRRASARSSAVLVDLALHPVASDPRLWSEDRLHANALGHARIADALAHSIGLPGTDDTWTHALPSPLTRSLRARVTDEAAWWRTHFFPWIARHARGRSSADGRTAKRPELLLVAVPTQELAADPG